MSWTHVTCLVLPSRPALPGIPDCIIIELTVHAPCSMSITCFTLAQVGGRGGGGGGQGYDHVLHPGTGRGGGAQGLCSHASPWHR